MKRVSIYLLYGVSILTAVMLYDFYKTNSNIRDIYRSHFAARADRLNDVAFVCRSYYEARPDVGELADFLESRRHLNDISFWALYKNGRLENTSIVEKEIGHLAFDFSKPGSKVWFDAKTRDYFYATENFGDGRQLVVGLRQVENEYVKAEFSIQKNAMIDYLVGLLVICFAIFVFFFRDISKSVRELARGGRRSYRKISVNSKEADLLLRGFASYDERQSELLKEKDLLSGQVLPSLRAELMSGRQPPYDFACTLVRTDINNFSKIYNEHPVDAFAATIDQFFTEASHVIARYGGLVHEFIGDEVIFYFKDENVGDSVAAALSAIRDINDVAATISKLTLENRGYPFTVKSSFARGQLRYGRFVNGYGIAGPILIETVRILSHVREKDGNVVVFDERHLESVRLVADAEPYLKVQLKGFADEKNLFSYRRHRTVGELLELFHDRENESALDRVRYFRSDEDLCAILAWARGRAPEEEARVLLRIIGRLREVKVTKSNGVPQKLLLVWIEDMIRSIETDPTRAETKCRVLSSSLRLMENLVPATEFSIYFENALRRAMDLKDRRVLANALDALTLFRRDDEPSLAPKLSRHLDNRVAANAIVHEGVRAISPFVVKRLSKMMASRNVANVASALYALGEIAIHQRTVDPVYYGTQIAFLRLVQSLPDFVLHPDSRVRRQALMAARKSADPATLEKIHHAARSNEALKKEAAEHLEPVRLSAPAPTKPSRDAA